MRGSESSARALRLAIRLARTTNARLSLLHVGLVPGYAGYDPASGALTYDRDATLGETPPRARTAAAWPWATARRAGTALRVSMRTKGHRSPWLPCVVRRRSSARPGAGRRAARPRNPQPAS
jgi:hypothetical protein